MADKNVKRDIQQLLACCNEFFDKKDEKKNSAVIATIINGLDKLNTIDLYALRSQLMKSLDAIQAQQMTKTVKNSVVSDYKLVNGNNGQFMVIEFNDQNKEGKVVFTTTDRKAAEELINQNSNEKTGIISADEMGQQQPQQNHQQSQNNQEQIPQDDNMDMPPMEDEMSPDNNQQNNQQNPDNQQNGGMSSEQLQRIDNVINQASELADKIERAAHEHVDLDAMKDLVVDTLAIRSAIDAIQNASTDDANVEEMVTNLENQLPQFEEKATGLINKSAPDLEDTDVPEPDNFDADNMDMQDDEMSDENVQQPQQNQQQEPDMRRPMSNQQNNQEPVTSSEKVDDEDDSDEEDVDIMADSEDSDDSPSAEDIEETLDEDDNTDFDLDEEDSDVPLNSDLYNTLSELSDLVSDEDTTKEDISDALDDILDDFDVEDFDIDSDSDTDTLDTDDLDSDIDFDDDLEDSDNLDEDNLDDDNLDDEELESDEYFSNRDYDKPVESSTLLESDIWQNDPFTEKGVKVTKPSLTETVNLKETVSDIPDDGNTVDDQSAIKKQGLKKVTDKIIDDDTKPLDGKNPVQANVLKWKEFDKNNVLVTKQKSFKTEKAKSVFANKLKDKDNFYSIV